MGERQVSELWGKGKEAADTDFDADFVLDDLVQKVLSH